MNPEAASQPVEHSQQAASPTEPTDRDQPAPLRHAKERLERVSEADCINRSHQDTADHRPEGSDATPARRVGLGTPETLGRPSL